MSYSPYFLPSFLSFFVSHLDGLIRNVSERPTLSVSFSRCNTYTTCQSTVNGSCIIYISLNSSNVVSETSVEGMINSSIALPDLTLNRLYYYRAVFHIGRTVQSEGNITTVQCKCMDHICKKYGILDTNVS